MNKKEPTAGIDFARFFRPSDEIMVRRTLVNRIKVELKMTAENVDGVYLAAMKKGLIEPGPMVGLLKSQATVKIGRPGILNLTT